jgi:hypothetical protein
MRNEETTVAGDGYDDAATSVVVEVGDWEHECCGPAYERDTVVELTCFAIPRGDDDPVLGGVRYLETHHDGLTTNYKTTSIRGRVSDLAIEHLDGSIEPIERLPGGRAIRGFDDDDDGRLEQQWTGLAVINDSNRFLVTIVS